MPVLEVAGTLFGLVELYAKLTDGREGDAAEQRATVALVIALLHRETFAVGRSYRAEGVDAAVTNTTTKWKLAISGTSVEIGVLGDGLLIELGGDLAGLSA